MERREKNKTKEGKRKWKEIYILLIKVKGLWMIGGRKMSKKDGGGENVNS